MDPFKQVIDTYFSLRTPDHTQYKFSLGTTESPGIYVCVNWPKDDFGRFVDLARCEILYIGMAAVSVFDRLTGHEMAETFYENNFTEVFSCALDKDADTLQAIVQALIEYYQPVLNSQQSDKELPMATKPFGPTDYAPQHPASGAVVGGFVPDGVSSQDYIAGQVVRALAAGLIPGGRISTAWLAQTAHEVSKQLVRLRAKDKEQDNA